LAFSPDGRTLALGTADWSVRLYEVASGQERAALKGHALANDKRVGGVSALAFSPDGKRLLSAGQEPPSHGPGEGQFYHAGEFVLWDVAAQTKLASVRFPAANGTTVRWTPDGKTAVLAWYDYSDARLKLLDAAGRELADFKGLGGPLLVSPDDR